MNTHEIKDILKQGAVIDAAVAELSDAICVPNQNDGYRVDGLTYERSVEGPGVIVRLHGITLVTKYGQVKADGEYGIVVYGRLSFCLKDEEGLPGESIHSILIQSDGWFSMDGSKFFSCSMIPEKIDHSRHRLSCTLAEAIQARMPRLQ